MQYDWVEVGCYRVYALAVESPTLLPTLVTNPELSA